MSEVVEDSTDAAPPPVASAYGDGSLDFEALFDMSAPQENYRKLIDAGELVRPMDGMAFAFDRPTVEFVARSADLFSSHIEMGLGNIRPLIPLNVDPPNHSKYRKLLDPLFTPRRMDEQEEDITNRVNGFIDTFVDRGECNFTEEFAELFPSSVFLGLCGLPEEDLRMFLDLRDGILHPQKIDPDALVDPEKRRAIMAKTGGDIYEYFGGLIERRKREPADDLASRFLAADVGGERLSDDEILDIFFLFLIAGLDTVSDSLTCFYAFLATHPDHRRQIVDDPAIIPNAVEELLRWESPVPQSVPRVATRDVELPDGTMIPQGTAMLLNWGAANLDAATFDDPFEVRFDREMNPHIAFATGVHRCLGSHLARRELRIALREWHRRIPEYSLKPGHEQLEYPPGLRHVKDLTLAWPT